MNTKKPTDKVPEEIFTEDDFQISSSDDPFITDNIKKPDYTHKEPPPVLPKSDWEFRPQINFEELVSTLSIRQLKILIDTAIIQKKKMEGKPYYKKKFEWINENNRYLVNKAVITYEKNSNGEKTYPLNKFKQFYPSDYDDSETVPEFNNEGFVLPEKRHYFFFVNNKRYYITEQYLAEVATYYNIEPNRIVRDHLVTRYGYEHRYIGKTIEK